MNTFSNYRVRLIIGLLFLVYAIAGKVFHLQGATFAFEMAGIFLIFGIISWIAAQGKKKEVAEQQ